MKEKSGANEFFSLVGDSAPKRPLSGDGSPPLSIDGQVRYETKLASTDENGKIRFNDAGLKIDAEELVKAAATQGIYEDYEI